MRNDSHPQQHHNGNTYLHTYIHYFSLYMYIHVHIYTRVCIFAHKHTRVCTRIQIWGPTLHTAKHKSERKSLCIALLFGAAISFADSKPFALTSFCSSTLAHSFSAFTLLCSGSCVALIAASLRSKARRCLTLEARVEKHQTSYAPQWVGWPLAPFRGC